MDLSPSTTTSTPVDEKLWLGAEHGTDCTRTVTLNITGGSFDSVLVAAEDGAAWAYIPSGTPIAESATPGEYELAAAAAPGPLAIDGHLFESVRVRTGTNASDRVGGSLLWHGVVVAAQVPVDGFTAADGATDHILYV